MNSRTCTRTFGAVAVLLIIVGGCQRSANREAAKGLVTKFEEILQQKQTLDDLEEKAKQYDAALENALKQGSSIRAAKALGAWAAEYRALLSQARSLTARENEIIDAIVTDSARLTGDAARHGREATDALREHVSALQRGIETAERIIAAVESDPDDPAKADLTRLDEFNKILEELEAKEKEAFQRAQDSIARLRAMTL